MRGGTPCRFRRFPAFQGGAVGFLGYEVVRHFEELPPPGRDDLGLPDAMLMFVDTFIVFDHLHRTIKLVSQAVSTGDPTGDYQRAVERIDRLHDALTEPFDARLLPFAPSRSTTPDQGPANMTRLEYERAVRRTKEYIAAGDIIQAVISLRLVRELEVSAFSVYRHLRRVNPSPYMYFLDMGGFQVVGASPEMLAQAEGRRIRTRPLAGTRPRGETPDEDSALAAELMASDKERAEHVMLVDLGRNDIGRVAEGRNGPRKHAHGGGEILARDAHRVGGRGRASNPERRAWTRCGRAFPPERSPALRKSARWR